MKKHIAYLWFLFAGLSLFSACNEDKIQTYEAGNYVYFTPLENDADSIFISLFNYPGVDRKPIEIGVRLVGRLLTQDTPYRVEVIDSLTTAASSSYELASEQIFHAGQTADTMSITLIKSDDLTEDVQIALQIVPNSHFAGSVITNEFLRIIFNNKASQPLWWDSETIKFFLGPWSAKKNETLFLALQDAGYEDVTDLTDASFTERRRYALILKQYIADHDVREENGDPMTVPVN